MLSVVIPTLDVAAMLPATLAALGRAPVDEIVVADGGSRDTTREAAAAAGARVVVSAPGRGIQLAAGARAASGDWLLFWHADTRPGANWWAALEAFVGAPENRARAGYWRFALDDPAPAARRLEAIVAWRCRHLALPYGDQGLVIARTLYEAVGGYRQLALMEDVDLVRRLGRARLSALPASALTSAARYRHQGYIRRPLRNLVCLAGYFLGLPDRAIARLHA